VLDVLRQPMEDRLGAISRAQGSLTFPANFQPAAAQNPCQRINHNELMIVRVWSPAAVPTLGQFVGGFVQDAE